MPNPQPPAEPDTPDMGPLLAILDGMVATRLLTYAARPDELARAYQEADAAADQFLEGSDRIVAPENFESRGRHFLARADQALRANSLSTAALCLALGARQPGGVDWAGRHWCAEPHDGCPNQPDPLAAAIARARAALAHHAAVEDDDTITDEAYWQAHTLVRDALTNLLAALPTQGAA